MTGCADKTKQKSELKEKPGAVYGAETNSAFTTARPEELLLASGQKKNKYVISTRLN